MKREVVKIRVDDSVYVLDKGFVDMVRSKRGFFWGKKIITDEQLVSYSIECDTIYVRRDLSCNMK